MSADPDAKADAFVLGLSENAPMQSRRPRWTMIRSGLPRWRARDRMLPLDLMAADLSGAAVLWDRIVPLLADQGSMRQPRQRPCSPIRRGRRGCGR